MNSHILLISEGSALGKLHNHLQGNGKTCHLAAPLAKPQSLPAEPIDLVVFEDSVEAWDRLKTLDMLCDMKEENHSVPFIVYGDLRQTASRLAAYESGADDVIDREVPMAELSARLDVIARRSNRVQGLLRAGALKLDLHRQNLIVEGVSVHLTSIEVRLLALFFQASGLAQSRAHLLREIWGYSSNCATRTLDTHIKRLRGKLGVYADCLETVRGLGYVFDMANKEPQSLPPAPPEPTPPPASKRASRHPVRAGDARN